jgi:hypothetical protein
MSAAIKADKEEVHIDGELHFIKGARANKLGNVS